VIFASDEWYIVDRKHFESYPYVVHVSVPETVCEMEVEVVKPVTIYASDYRMALMIVEE